MRGAQKAQPFGHPLDGRVRPQLWVVQQAVHTTQDTSTEQTVGGLRIRADWFVDCCSGKGLACLCTPRKVAGSQVSALTMT